MEAKKDKERLILEVEKEEELMSNTLQKKMQTLMKEKVDLESALEREQEYAVNKLQRQMAQAPAPS